MIKKLGIYSICVAMGLAAVSCNDDDSYVNDYSIDYASTQVKSFSLKSDSKVLHNLDSVFFSIDLVNARIFNADSLPLGTKISRLLVELTTDNCSTVELHFPRPGKTDSIVDYLTHPNDSIDFSNGPVKLHLVSFDKVGSRDYTISVNVHKTIADSLYWNVDAPTTISTTLSAPVAQRTVRYNDNFYTLTADALGNACLNTAATPYDAGMTSDVTLPSQANVNSFTATATAMYILDNSGTLYTSADGSTWNSCNTTWKAITAPYGSTLTGISETDGKLYHVTYPAGKTSPVKDNFPISGTSQTIQYATEWGQKAQIIIAGGRQSDGKTTPSTWAYDGNNWACLNNKTPMDVEGLTLFPYYCCLTDTNTWVASSRSVLVAMGGRTSDNKMNGDVYISYDLGFNWQKAPQTMQLSSRFPALSDAQAFVVDEEQHSRAIRPITEWDTPFIYLYGGYNQNRALVATIYRGVVKRLEFKPLQ